MAKKLSLSHRLVCNSTWDVKDNGLDVMETKRRNLIFQQSPAVAVIYLILISYLTTDKDAGVGVICWKGACSNAINSPLLLFKSVYVW